MQNALVSNQSSLFVTYLKYEHKGMVHKKIYHLKSISNDQCNLINNLNNFLNY